MSNMGLNWVGLLIHEFSTASATPEQESLTPSFPPPPQPIPHEDDENEGLYDDPLPLNE